MPPDPERPRNAYVREDCILPHLPALHLLLTGAEPAAGGCRRRRTRHGADVRCPASEQDVIMYLRRHQITLIYDQATGTLQAGTSEAAKTLIRKAS
jgi:site-specific DNA recombinase